MSHEPAAESPTQPTPEAAAKPAPSTPVLLRPLFPIAVVTLAWVAASSTPAMVNMVANAQSAWVGMMAWLAASGLAAIAGALAGTLAARLEQASAERALGGQSSWRGLGAAVVVVAHWGLHLSWGPILLLGALQADYDFEDRLLSAIVAGLAWPVVAVVVAAGLRSSRALRSRDPSAALEPRPRRLDTSVIAGLLYATFALAPAAVATIVGVDEGEPVGAIGTWMVAGVLLGAPPAALAVATWARLPRAGTPAVTRFWEVLGAVWLAHWALPLLGALLPVWRDSDHGSRLAVAFVAAVLAVAAAAVWGVARAHRLVGPAQAPAAG